MNTNYKNVIKDKKRDLKWQSKNARNAKKYGVDDPNRTFARTVVVSWKRLKERKLNKREMLKKL